MPSPAFVEHCVELLAPLGAVRVKRMFSGHGYYVDGVFLALSIGDRLYLKTDEGSRARMAAAGAEPFTYEGPRGMVTMSYWTAPAEAMDSPALMLPWARQALQAALAARAARPPVRRRAGGATKRAAAPAPAAVTTPARKSAARKKPAAR